MDYDKTKKQFIKLRGLNIFLLLPFLLFGLFKGYETSAGTYPDDDLSDLND